MGKIEQELLQATRTLIAEHPAGFDQGTIRLPPHGDGPPCGCVASYLVAANTRAQKLLDGSFEPGLAVLPTRRRDIEIVECNGSVILSASYALGYPERLRLFKTEWPTCWFRRTTETRSEYRQPTAAEAIEVLDAVANGELREALTPQDGK